MPSKYTVCLYSFFQARSNLIRAVGAAAADGATGSAGSDVTFFPLAEILVCAGFFLVYFVEEVVMFAAEPSE